MQAVRKSFIEALFQLSIATTIQCDLEKDAMVRSMDAEIISSEDQLILRVLREDLKPIVRRDVEDIQQRLVDDLADSCALFLGFSFEHIDSNQRHISSSNNYPRSRWFSHGTRRSRAE
jgi:hypothetical protein